MADTIESEDSTAVVETAPPRERVRWGRRVRRPSGAPPPLPRKLGVTGGMWIALIVAGCVGCIVLKNSEPTFHLLDRVDSWWLRLVQGARAPWLTHAVRGINALGTGFGLTVLGLGLGVALMVFRRWRHLLVFLGSLGLLLQFGGILLEVIGRPRPYDVRIIGGWSGFSMPSPPVGIFAALLVGILYTMLPPGRWRNRSKWVVLGVLAIFVLAREYLAVDHPSDALFSVVLGVGVPVVLFRFFTPNEVFRISYKRRGNMAHLDVTGARGDAVRRAVSDQLGLTVLEIKPFGEEGSGGSTPLRLKVQGDPDTYLFAKLYAKSHVRADRWYKIWRTILYGRLEDETPFQNVRRFVEYEDYALLLLQDFGVKCPKTYGVVEITPEREYMIVMEFFDGAKEIGEAEVDEHIIDQGLALIRKLWDVGVAHRDVKPANLMVRGGELLLIDVFFVQLRPSPWRQAVDLGNMMLVLAVRSDPDLVYQRALRVFTPDEISEAFAATRGVASPTQLRAFMKRDGRDLLGRFRSLAPARRPIAVQRWSVRRVFLALAMIGGITLAVVEGVSAFLPSQNGSDVTVAKAPACETGDVTILMAQSVPTATTIPCIATLPSGWTFGMASIRDGRTQFWLNSDQAGGRAVVVTLTARCDTTGAQEVPSDEPGTTRFESPESLQPFRDRRSYLFPGGCVTYDLSSPGSSSTVVFAADSALSFVPRATLVRSVARDEDLGLCGAGAACIE